MSSESPPRTMLCEEVFDENSQPSEEEVREYAVRIGIEPDNEPQLLGLARDGLMKALPSGWTPCFDQKKKAWYYFNYDTGSSQWEHPLDCVYRDLVRKNRSESASSAGEEDSKTSAKEDLKSFEEAAVLSLDATPKQLEPLKPSGSLLKRATTQLAPLKKFPSRLEPVGEKKHKLIPRPPPSPTPISVPGPSKGDDKLLKAQEKHPKSMHGRTELTLSGGGTSFLKKPLTPSSDSSLSEGHEDNAPVWTKPAILTPPRGILRDKSPQRLWDLDPSNMNSEEKQQLQRQELEEERKSVRFNLEEGAGLQIRFLEEEDDFPDAGFPSGESVTIRLHPPEPNDDLSNSDEEDIEIETAVNTPAVIKNDENKTILEPVESKKIMETVETVIEPIIPKVKFIVEKTDEKAMELHRLTCESDAKLKLEIQKLKFEAQKKLSDLREKLLKDEEEEIKSMNKNKEERLKTVELNISKELETREANIRNGAERTLEQLREELASSMEKQLAALRSEKQSALVEEEASIKKIKTESEEKISALRKSFLKDHDKLVQDQKSLMEEENILKLEKIKQDLVLQHEKEVSKFKEGSEEAKKQKIEQLEKEFYDKEHSQLSNLKKRLEELLKEKMESLERDHEEDLQDKKMKLELQAKEKIAQINLEGEHQIKIAKDKLTDEHNAAVDKIKTEQLVTFENLRLSLQREEEEMQSANRIKLANLSDKLNIEYESRLKRLRELAEKKTKMLEEEERTKFEQQGTVASLSRTLADVDNSGGHQRCEQLQRQIELLSIKLRECRRQLEEAKASRPDDRVFEKLRCEKRLLEDKYRTLKDKYVRLKADVKQSLEKRNKKRLAVENNRAGGTTGSETDRSTSQKHNIEKPAKKLPPTEETVQESMIEASEANNNNNIDTHTSSNKESLITSPPPTDSSDRMSPPPVLPRRGRRHPSKLKSSSTPRLDRTTANPVENLRTQLKKLEDLEDLFPASTHTDTYLRYPFSDSGQVGSCELEFFRHRIHLERDSVQRAKEFLKQQRQTFASRQRELRQRQSSLGPPGGRMHSELLKDSILQEERELSDMEVSLHRTRSLLGEKIIRLRQLEHSLQQAATSAAVAQRNTPVDATLSDLSSHSGSSGFSSNENPSEATAGRRRRAAATAGYQESSEIVRSLETLNAEIRSLWDLLQRQNGDQLPAGPPPLLVPGSESPWPALTTLAEQLQQIRLQQQVAANSSLVTSAASAASLAERAQGLRDWLRRARLDSAQLTPST